MKREFAYFLYRMLSILPDKFISSLWFKFISNLRARVLNLMPNMTIEKDVLIYQNMRTTKKSNIIIKRGTVIKENCILIGNIKIGSNCNILNNTTIDGSGNVIIGDNSHIGRENDIYSHNHDISNKNILVNQSKEIFYTTIIGNNVMLFSKVGIMAGVRIDDNVVIAYGSVVTKDCEASNIYAGIPAKKIGERI